ncbi:LysR family transcriptional regulator [Paraburkholderia sp. MM5384-R2]|uniref:LysR family transcriptional regulator n=1 Tax=Paraburkholderia sp. MM5384-R2 TaxID=2723097 RepID=UPI001803C555|nr:LysR family transcriptional regulator [Paraburkholderia sp. MM5384-R2]MBB5503563.1 DNA-binding transcriptional LysR family regulator [Paraburkholderia sp. MM5384-R2]
MSAEEEGISERTLEYLGAVAKHGGMRQAAESLGVNVSTISRQIASAERHLRLALVSRRGRSISLTQVGVAAVEYGHERARHAKRFRAQLAEYRDLRRGHVTLAVGEGLVGSLISVVLKRFHQKYPDIVMDIRTGPLPDLIRMVRDDEADICVSIGTSRDPLLNARLFQREPLCAIVPASHPLASMASVRIEDLVHGPLIFMSGKFAAQGYVNAMFWDADLSVSPAFTCDLFTVASSLVAQNLGIAFMTKWAAKEKVDAGLVVAVPIQHPIANTFERYVATRVGRRLSPAASFLCREIVRLMSSV